MILAHPDLLHDDLAVRIAGDLGTTVVDFYYDVNGDAGATAGPRQGTAALESASAGSIVIAHMNQPGGGTAEGVAAALPRLVAEASRSCACRNTGSRSAASRGQTLKRNVPCVIERS